jgi:hypothetical protein
MQANSGRENDGNEHGAGGSRPASPSPGGPSPGGSAPDGPAPGEPEETHLKASLSCRRFVAYALLLGILFVAAHLAGLREYTSVLSGTGILGFRHRFFGTAYILLYFGFVGIVPVLIIASALLKGMAALISRRMGPGRE